MPRLTNVNPSYRRHRASGQAVVTLNGIDHYLGPHGTKASRNEYDRVIAEWLVNGRRDIGSGSDLTVSEIVAKYWLHAQIYYRRPDGTPGNELVKVKTATAPLVRLYGRTPANAFGPLALDAVRAEMITFGWCRESVNSQIGRVKMLFKWAVAKEMIPSSVHHGLTAVAGLQRGRTAARESTPVRPVAMVAVEQTIPHLSPTIAAMVRLQLLTGARPGEICSLRTRDIDQSGEVWTITPADHKTAHHGHARTIHVGPHARVVLLPFLNLAAPDAFIFSPAAAESDRLARLHEARKTPISCGNRPGTNRRLRPKRKAGDRYDVAGYRRAIARACDIAFPAPAPLARQEIETLSHWQNRLTSEQRQRLADWQSAQRWHPHQLRHTAATAIRKQFGLEAAQFVLGHTTLKMTEIYAERNADAAKAVAAAIG